MNTSNSPSPRVYVACLHCYNSGILAGSWHDADTSLADSVEEWQESHGTAYCEEYAIHDHEDFGGYSVGEYDSLDTIGEIGEAIGDHGEAFLAWLSCCDPADPTYVSDFEDSYAGEWDSEEDYAMEFASEIGFNFDQTWPNSYIDWASATRDLMMDYSTERRSGSVFIFRNY